MLPLTIPTKSSHSLECQQHDFSIIFTAMPDSLSIFVQFHYISLFTWIMFEVKISCFNNHVRGFNHLINEHLKYRPNG